jgi:signal transduction histidine kinase
MNRRVLVVLVLAGAIVIAAAALLVAFAHAFQPFGRAEKLAQVATNGIWIIAGLIAWQRRPRNRVGPLMTAVGFADVAQQLYWNSALPFTLAELVAFFAFPIGLHLFLAFPSGRLQTRFERALVTSTYAAIVVFSVFSQLSWDPRSDPHSTDCPDCPRNLLLVHHYQGLWSALGTVGMFWFIAVLVTAAVLLIGHVRRSSGATRRALAPVVLAAAVAAGLLGAVIVASAFGVETEGSVLLWLADVAYAAIPLAFLGGLLRTRLHRSAVADLVLELDSLPSPAKLEAALARCLGDPSLEVAFWLPDAHRYVDADGNALEPGERPGRALTVLEHDGTRLAALVYDPALVDEPELVEAVGAAASLALENARLQAELRSQLAEVRASRARIVAAGDEARRRLERDLHDGAQQRLLGIRLALRLVRSRVSECDAGVDELLAEADAEVVGALDELRALARGIHPAILTEEGLAAALSGLARRAAVPVELAVCQERLPARVEATAYFVAAEALANVVKHAHASRVSIEVARANGEVAIEVSDDGSGGADPGGPGLRGLRDRVEALDGRLRVESPAGGGSRVRAAIPCA